MLRSSHRLIEDALGFDGPAESTSSSISIGDARVPTPWDACGPGEEYLTLSATRDDKVGRGSTVVVGPTFALLAAVLAGPLDWYSAEQNISA